jgi:hypothetical protein
MSGPLDAPIPGQSLTIEPGNAPWEQPPLYPKVEQALAWHLKNLSNPDRMDEMMFLLDQGLPISTLVESLTSYAQMKGYHNVDVSQIIMPVLHEYIKTMADAADIKAKEDDGPTPEERDKMKLKSRLNVVLNKELGGDDEDDIADSIGMEAVPTDTPSTEDQLDEMRTQEEEDKPKGFIGRRV